MLSLCSLYVKSNASCTAMVNTQQVDAAAVVDGDSGADADQAASAEPELSAEEANVRDRLKKRE